MNSKAHRISGVRGYHLSTQDALVVTAGAVAVTYPWWEGLAAWIPHIAQVVITTGTIIFVLFRMVNEIRRFLQERGKN